MRDPLGYEGRTVVMTGAASGMGDAAARLLVELGAEVHVLDIGEVTAPVAGSIVTDLSDEGSIAAAVSRLPDEVHALFNCAGVPHPPAPPLTTMLVNFVGLRAVTEALVPRIPAGGAIASIASSAGAGWRDNLDRVQDFLGRATFGEASAWLEANPDPGADPYGFSKQAIIVYTMARARELAGRGVRINCIAPSPTEGAFLDRLTGEGGMPPDLIEAFGPPIGRFATAGEMAGPLVLLNSALAGFVSGQCLQVDYGYSAEVLTGQRENLLGY